LNHEAASSVYDQEEVEDEDEFEYEDDYRESIGAKSGGTGQISPLVKYRLSTIGGTTPDRARPGGALQELNRATVKSPFTFFGQTATRRKSVFSWFKRHVVVSICGVLILLYILFELVTQVFVYCRDAYVTTDIFFVAPEVSGPIAKLPIRDNQKIDAGSVLFVIDL